MAVVDFASIEKILLNAHRQGRLGLYEHECYDLLSSTGAEAAPAHRLIAPGSRPTRADLEAIASDKVVLKVVSPDIIHKTEARGVRIVARELGAVEATFELMRREVPEAFAGYLAGRSGDRPAALAGLGGEGLRRRIADRLTGILLCGFVEPDAQRLRHRALRRHPRNRRVRTDHLGRPRRGRDGGARPSLPARRRDRDRPDRHCSPGPASSSSSGRP